MIIATNIYYGIQILLSHNRHTSNVTIYFPVHLLHYFLYERVVIRGTIRIVREKVALVVRVHPKVKRICTRGAINVQ